MTDRYAVIGNPIAHSKSPQIHRMFADQFKGQQAGDIDYERIEAPLDGFAATIERLRNEGYKGCNVTVPFKFEAFKLATELSERAQTAQAVNTLKFDARGIYGDNTDGAGLVRDIEQNFGIDLNHKHALLLGAGGAAYGVAQPLLQAGVRLTIENRTREKAELLATRLDTGNQMRVIVGYRDDKPVDLIINATSSGLSDEMPALPPIIFAPNALAYDMMYGRETPFMAFARAHGTRVADGLGMLVEQAAEAFYIWRGVRPETAQVIAALRNKP
ncbi:MAG TPA: shikimate dehydrogenase [Gallionella sp.]|nr:shikimate dehydrogenase [Gallionella sp.]